MNAAQIGRQRSVLYPAIERKPSGNWPTDAPAEATSGTDGCLSLWAAPQVSEEGLWLGAKR